MTLPKAVYYALVVAYATFLLATLAVLLGAAINIADLGKINLTAGFYVMGASLALRLILANCLHWLGGKPPELERK